MYTYRNQRTGVTFLSNSACSGEDIVLVPTDGQQSASPPADGQQNDKPKKGAKKK